MKKEVVLLLGAPGSGKGTQAVGVSKQFRDSSYFNGRSLSLSYQKSDVAGVQVKDYLDQGKLVPDDIVLGISLNA